MKAIIKPGNGQKREMLYRVIPLPAPFTINLVTSTVCNFQCVYCVHTLSEEKKRSLQFFPEIMSWEVFKQAVEQIGQFPILPKVIFLYGVGEPMCNPLLTKMIRYIKKKYEDLKVSFITNGSLLNKENIPRLIEAGLDEIRISIQGISSEAYKKVCNKVLDYEQFINNLTFLYDNKKQCQIYIKIIDIALNGKEDQSKFFSLFGDLADKIFIEKCMPVFEGVDYSELEKECMDRYGNRHRRRVVCPQPFFTLSVMPDGEVKACDNLKNPWYLGNICNQSLAQIWNGEKLRNFWKLQLLKERRTNLVCQHCVAPDDVAQSEDELDDYTFEILERLRSLTGCRA